MNPVLQLEVERALLEGELVPLREKAAVEEERLAALLQKSQELEERCHQERQHHQEAIEVGNLVVFTWLWLLLRKHGSQNCCESLHCVLGVGNIHHKE